MLRKTKRISPRSTTSKRPRPVLGYDLGGTKVHVGAVSPEGLILESHQEAVVIGQGKKALIDQLARLGRPFIEKYGIEAVGLASAGPLDPTSGELLDPTNFRTKGERWGVFPIAPLLEKALKRPVKLENDAASAVLAENWVGGAINVRNCMVITLGTGLGTAIICNGTLVRSGRYLHTEAGHLILDPSDKSMLCGCGNYGCSETYLSGVNFAKRVSKKLKRDVSGEELVRMAGAKNKTVLQAFEEYADKMAQAIHNYVVIFSPEAILFSGSFSKASTLFLPGTRKRLKELLKNRRQGIDLMPATAISPLGTDSGLIGAARVALVSDRVRGL